MSQARLELPPALDLNAAAALRSDMQAHAHAPLDLDAAKVERVGGLCVQVLIAAAIAWREEGVQLRVVNASNNFRDDVRLLGATDLIAIQTEN